MFEDFLPPDPTPEEIELLKIIKLNMLRDLQDDRTRLVFITLFQLDWSQRDVAHVLGVHETEIVRQKDYIKGRLHKYRKGYTKL